MLSADDIERSEEVFNALGDQLAIAYHPAQFSIRQRLGAKWSSSVCEVLRFVCNS